MGFRSNTWAKVWSIEPVRDTITKCRISISRKDRNTGEYIQDFGGFIAFVGTAAASKAAKLKEGDSIRLGDVDVTNRYDKEREITYTNFNCYSFETNDEVEGNGATSPQQHAPTVDVNYGIDNGEVEAELPF